MKTTPKSVASSSGKSKRLCSKADTPATLIADLRAQLAATTDLAAKTQAALTRAERTLSTIVQRGARDFAHSLPDCTLPYDPHRAAHRPGTRPKIASDPGLQAVMPPASPE